jgi:CRISPR-associated protein Cmr1
MADGRRLQYDWSLRALTPIWTGDPDGRPDRLIMTGLLGSIRWWCEVLARGLGGAACDPTDKENRCSDGDGRCPVCELFGCSGWARKFRFEVRDTEGKVLGQKISKDREFVLRFTPLRHIEPEQWALLDLTLRLIAGYGAMGGKTVLKPSDEAARATRPYHQDYGLVEIERSPATEPVLRSQLASYVGDQRWRRPPEGEFAWASLSNFWCVNGRYLARQAAHQSTFNKVLGRKEAKTHAQQLEAANRAVNAWLAGRQQESKKVFSFKDPPRTFGFVDPDRITIAQMQERLEQVWGTLRPGEFMTGQAVLEELVREGGGT